MIGNKLLFLISKINRLILPKIAGKKDLTKLSNFDKNVIGYKYFITKKYLDSINEKDKLKLYKSFNIN